MLLFLQARENKTGRINAVGIQRTISHTYYKQGGTLRVDQSYSQYFQHFQSLGVKPAHNVGNEQLAFHVSLGQLGHNLAIHTGLRSPPGTNLWVKACWGTGQIYHPPFFVPQTQVQRFLTF